VKEETVQAILNSGAFAIAMVTSDYAYEDDSATTLELWLKEGYCYRATLWYQGEEWYVPELGMPLCKIPIEDGTHTALQILSWVPLTKEEYTMAKFTAMPGSTTSVNFPGLSYQEKVG